MNDGRPPSAGPAATPPAYVLEDQVGFVLRQVQQRHAAIFAAAFPDLTPMQWAALARLAEIGECSQNHLGRLIATDVATIKGIVDRLIRRGLADTRPDPKDRRRLMLSLSAEGRRVFRDSAAGALAVSTATLEPLSEAERTTFLCLLERLR